MVLASIDQCRRNTAAAGGWTWLAREAARCGQVFGVVPSMFFCAINFVSTCISKSNILSGEESHQHRSVHVRRLAPWSNYTSGIPIARRDTPLNSVMEISRNTSMPTCASLLITITCGPDPKPFPYPNYNHSPNSNPNPSPNVSG